jgi:uncharacterized protein
LTRAALLTAIAGDPLLERVLARVRVAAESDPAHDVDHLLRVALATLTLDPSLDRTEAICAALLHDVVNLPKDHPERALASQRSAEEARRLLAGALSAEAIERVALAIEDHSFSAGRVPRSPLGEALQDADRLEALGALGIARTFSTGVRMGARYFDPDDPWAERRALDDKAFSVDHFFTKLLRLPETFRTKMGRAEAEKRVAIMRAFLDAMGEEIGAPRPPESLVDLVIAALRAGRSAQVGGGRSFATYELRSGQPTQITSDDGFTEENPITEARLREVIEEHRALFADYLRHWDR